MSGKSSIRVGYGMYYTNIEGAATFNFAAPPYGLFYCCLKLLAVLCPLYRPARWGECGTEVSRLPRCKRRNQHQLAAIRAVRGRRSPLRNSPSPYAEHLDFSIQRQLQANTLVTVSYVGTFGHHLILDAQNNPANPALCITEYPGLGLPGTATCGPYGETGVFYPVNGPANGVTVRGPFNSINPGGGAVFGDEGYYLDDGNSDYHALQISLRKTAGRWQLLLAYTFSKAMDNGSGFGDQVP